MNSKLVFISSVIVCVAVVSTAMTAEPGPVELKRDDKAGTLQVLISGREAFVFRYGADEDLPHYYPLLSPSGKPLTIQKTEPYPHHRSVWFADTVRLEGQRAVSFYNALYTAADRKNPEPPFKDTIRHVEFLPDKTEGRSRLIGSRLLWVADDGTMPVLDERREVRVVPLDNGEYLLDMAFTIAASYGDVEFVSDAAHYAWPYVRMHPEFSVAKGGTMTSSEGGVNQKETHGKAARWIDYSNTVGGETEGLAFFSHTDNEHPHTWLTRDYGTFGPRRADARNGRPFTLKKGGSLKQRVGILIHRGDVKTGRVAERYEQYVKGQLR